MQHLFWTWRGVFPPVPLRTIETELQLNPKPGGPATGNQTSRAMEPSVRPGHGIHVNPKYLEQRQLLQQSRTSRVCISYLPYFDVCSIYGLCILQKRNLTALQIYGRQMFCVSGVSNVYFSLSGVLMCAVLCSEQADGIAPAERNGDGPARQDRAALRENSKGWPETQRSTVRSEQSCSRPKARPKYVRLVACLIFFLEFGSCASKAW